MTVVDSPRITAPAGVARLFASGGTDFSDHLDRFGDLPRIHPDSLITELEASGLAGRGGAGFPAWRKLAAARGAASGPGSRPVVIANGSEGEPLSAKDAALLRAAPHLVIDGLLLAAATIGATELHFVVDDSVRPAVALALCARPDAAGIGLRAAGAGFVAGEASAVVNLIERGRAVPRDHPARLTTSGLRRRPTLVQNVETLAHVALIARFGARWFQSVGVEDDPGTRLVSVSGPGEPVRVLEIASGTPLRRLLTDAGLTTTTLNAVLIGGYHGTWVRATDSALDASFSSPGLALHGAAPGAGIVHALPHGRCALVAAAGIAGYLAGESSGQCGPCVNGLPRISHLLERIANREQTPALAAELGRVSDLVAGRGACHHPDGTVRFVASTLEVFADDVAAHLSGYCLEETP